MNIFQRHFMPGKKPCEKISWLKRISAMGRDCDEFVKEAAGAGKFQIRQKAPKRLTEKVNGDIILSELNKTLFMVAFLR